MYLGKGDISVHPLSRNVPRLRAPAPRALPRVPECAVRQRAAARAHSPDRPDGDECRCRQLKSGRAAQRLSAGCILSVSALSETDRFPGCVRKQATHADMPRSPAIRSPLDWTHGHASRARHPSRSPRHDNWDEPGHSGQVCLRGWHVHPTHMQYCA